MRKALLPLSLLAAATFASPRLFAATITGVSFTGTSANPTITLTGTGFNPEPTPSGFLPGGPEGYDFGGDPTVFTLSDNGQYSFTAGQDGDIVGLANISYSDTLVSYNLGSNYATNYMIQYALLQGDPYTVYLNGATYSGTVNYSVPTVPEPSSLALLATGLAGAAATLRRRLAR